MPIPPVPSVQQAITSPKLVRHIASLAHLDTTNPVLGRPLVSPVLLDITKCRLDRTTVCSAPKKVLRKEVVLLVV